MIKFSQLVSNILSSILLILVIVYALLSNFVKFLNIKFYNKPINVKDSNNKYVYIESKEKSKFYKSELITPNPNYYAENCGFKLVNEIVNTEDHYQLLVHKVIRSDTDNIDNENSKGYPVLILHGLFQSSGSFITSEERSLSFWLSNKGYQVYLGNTRGVFNMGHQFIKKNDPKFWNYNINNLALQDLPALINHVKFDSGFDKVAFIGHSQGNGLAFMSLSLDYCPSLSNDISSFIALAPTIYAGPLTTGFPFTAINHLDWKSWKFIFGELDFIPLMTWAFNYTPKRAFALLGYQMFSFLFSWTDKNWLNRRKAKMFRFTPSPVSSKSVHWWAGKDGFSTRGCTLDESKNRWFAAGHEKDSNGNTLPPFPPLSLYVGTDDRLVLVEPLLQRLKTHEDIRLKRVEYVQDGEHCDFFWAANAVEICFEKIKDDIEYGRLLYLQENEKENQKIYNEEIDYKN